jgi:hypothetical protein
MRKSSARRLVSLGMTPEREAHHCVPDLNAVSSSLGGNPSLVILPSFSLARREVWCGFL